MSPRTILVPTLLALLAIGCDSEDPRLPQSLYDEAVRLNTDGKMLEAKSLMELVAQRYPDAPAGVQAKKDLYTLDMFLKQDILDRQKQVRLGMRRTAEALARFKEKRGEYPEDLAVLVPDYLEKPAETAWGHPFFYRPYVKEPIQDIQGKRGQVSQRINNRFDGYFLVCMGVDLQPGGEGMAADTCMVDGDFYKEKALPTIPLPQPLR